MRSKLLMFNDPSTKLSNGNDTFWDILHNTTL